MVAMRGSSGRDSRGRERNGIHQRDRDANGGVEAAAGGGGGGGAIVTRVRQGASGALHSVLEGAHSVTQQLRDTTGEVTGAVVDTVLEEAERLYRKQKKPALSRISSFSNMAGRAAHALHAVKADGVADYVEQAAQQVGSVTEYLEDRDLGDVLEDAGEMVQRNRAVAMGVMFVAGFAVARFLKASASREEAEAAEGDAGGEAEEQEQRPAKKKKKKQRQHER